MGTGNTEAPENKWGTFLAALGNLLATPIQSAPQYRCARQGR